MYRRKIGQFNKPLDLLRPYGGERDEMGGKTRPSFEKAGRVFAQKRDKSVTMKVVIGAYVTERTCYFVIRDCRSTLPITDKWRVELEGKVYVINSINVLDDSRPYFLELECTWIGGSL